VCEGVRPERLDHGHDIPAIAKYENSVDDVARLKAMPVFERDWESAKLLARRIYSNAHAAIDGLRGRIVEGNADPAELGKQLRSTPETVGTLVGRTGTFGENAERRQALGLVNALAFRVEQSGKTWQRRFKAECSSEQWRREKEDVIDVPGLSNHAEALLRKLDDLPYVEKGAFVAQLKATIEGSKALDEASETASAIEKRFGRANPSDLAEQLRRAGLNQTGDIERIRDIVRLADRSHRAELTRQSEMKRSLSRRKGLRLGM
jgi:hypothetical protein